MKAKHTQLMNSTLSETIDLGRSWNSSQDIFTMNLWRRNFSLVARYSLKFTRCSLLVIKSLVTRCKIRSLLLAKVARCKKSLVTRCRSCSLLVAKIHSLLIAKFARYSLQKLLLAKNPSLLVTNFARCSL